MVYPKFRQTRKEIVFADRYAEVIWNGRNMHWYTGLGYQYTGYLDRFICQIGEVSPGSWARVRIMCPVCQQEREARYGDVMKVGHTLCLSCAKTKDLSGMPFGRWSVIELDTSHGVVGASYWICRCECGTIRRVLGASLMNGTSSSCGCINSERMKSIHGDNHPSWKGGNSISCCEWCGGEFYVPARRSSTARFCSTACHGKWKSENLVGKNASNWNPELTDEERIIRRNYPEYKEWIQSVLSRDRYVCQICGSMENVEAHHMYSYSYYPEHRIEVNYGLTMCHCCHVEFHSFMGGSQEECVPSDIDRWLLSTHVHK